MTVCCGGKGQPRSVSKTRYMAGMLALGVIHVGGIVLQLMASLACPRYLKVLRFHIGFVRETLTSVLRKERILVATDSDDVCATPGRS